jgi:hypothetical protein
MMRGVEGTAGDRGEQGRRQPSFFFAAIERVHAEIPIPGATSLALTPKARIRFQFALEKRWQDVPNEVTIHINDRTTAHWWTDTGLTKPARPHAMQRPGEVLVDVEQIDAREGTIVARSRACLILQRDGHLRLIGLENFKPTEPVAGD